MNRPESDDGVNCYSKLQDEYIDYLLMREKRLACRGCSWARMCTIYCEYCKKD